MAYVEKYSMVIAANLKNMIMSSSISKFLETGMNVFKSNSQIIKNIQKYYEISTKYECVEKNR